MLVISRQFLVQMYPETISSGVKSKPTSFSSKIRVNEINLIRLIINNKKNKKDF